MDFRPITPIDLQLMKQQFTLAENGYNPFEVVSENTHNPLVALFCPDATFHSKYQIVDLYHVGTPEEKIPASIYIKFAPLLDPIHFLIGKYDKNKTLAEPKIASAYNSAYIDGFFNYLSSTLLHDHNFVHGIDFFGSLSTTQKKFRFNIEDELDYLQDSEFFMNNNGTLYELDGSPVSKASGTMQKKTKLLFSDVDEGFEVDELDDVPEEENPETEGVELMFQVGEKEDSEDDDSQVSDSTDNSMASFSGTSEESSYDSEQKSAFLFNFPVHMIFLEKCDGTFDELLETQSLNEKEISSAMMQVVFMLIVYQQAFQFTHNDLHTNNIVFSKTTVPFLVYEYQNKFYRVPTYGRIYKMIDFGRSIYRVKDQKLCSDSFAVGGDAHSQYNTEPFLDDQKARLEPNPSFDLCRLGCSMYDFLFDVDKPLPTHMNEVQKTVIRWCQDDVGKNILYKKNGVERYPNFKLYKMISRLVHHCIPSQELSQPIFAQYVVESGEDAIHIDRIPKYFSSKI